MAIYKARGDPREKVIFLFSVNGSKKFCGMAEMSGEWEDTGPIDDWTDNPDGAKAHGYVEAFRCGLYWLTVVQHYSIDLDPCQGRALCSLQPNQTSS